MNNIQNILIDHTIWGKHWKKKILLCLYTTVHSNNFLGYCQWNFICLEWLFFQFLSTLPCLCSTTAPLVQVCPQLNLRSETRFWWRDLSYDYDDCWMSDQASNWSKQDWRKKNTSHCFLSPQSTRCRTPSTWRPSQCCLFRLLCSRRSSSTNDAPLEKCTK